MDKAKLMADVGTALDKHIEELRKSVRSSQEMTRDAPGRIESRYDTSREEMGWLATGQAALLDEWERSYAFFKAIRPSLMDFVQTGAFFEAESLLSSARIRCLVCYGGGGFECETSEGKVVLVSPSAPLAAAALGRGVNDVFSVEGRGDYIICKVA